MVMARQDANPAIVAFYHDDMRAAFDRFQDTLPPLIRFNVREAREGSKAGVAIAGSATAWIVSISTVVSVLCVGIG